MSQKKMAYLDEKYKEDSSYIKESIGLKADDIFVTHTDLIAKPFIDIEYVLYPILPKGGYVLLHAEAGAGKTYFALNLAYAIAEGGSFLKYAAPKPKKVLYVDAELGENPIRRRIDAIHKKNGKLQFDNLDYIFYDKFPNGDIPQIDTAQGREFYTNHIIKHGYEGVFLDNLLNLCSNDLNKVNEWHPIQQWIKMLRQKGIFFFLLHHSSSDITKQFGTVARNTIANTIISLQKIDDEEENGKIKVVYQKLRDVSNANPSDFHSFEARNHMNGEWSFKDIQISFDDEVLKMIKAGFKDRDIVDELKSNRMRVYRAKKRLERKNLL